MLVMRCSVRDISFICAFTHLWLQDVEDLVATANATRFGLGASVFVSCFHQ